MTVKVLLVVTACLVNLERITAQSSSNIGDFVGQLTSLINQGGALASYASAQGTQGSGYRPTGGYPNPAGPGGYPGPGAYPGSGGPGGYPAQHQGGYGFPGGFPPGGVPPGGIPQGGGGGPPPPGGYGGGGYVPPSLYGALASIAQYDDLRCVPRLLCEVASGARPGSAYTSSSSNASPIPFLSKDAIITLLTVLNFVDDSPLLVFGRAAVLGYTARGDSRQCLIAYPTCPRDPDKLVDYLNNHNGGFFRFFNQQIPQYAPQYQYFQQPPYPQHPGAPSAYPPQPQYPHPQEYYQYPQRPLPPQRYPQRPGQRPYRKKPTYPQYYQQQERIQNLPQGNEYEYFTSEGGTSKLIFSSNLESSQYYQQESNNDQNPPTNYYDGSKYSDYVTKYNDGNNYNAITNNNNNNNNNKKFAFPTEIPSSPAPSVIPLPSTASSIPSLYNQHDSTGSYSHRDVRKGKTLAFPNGATFSNNQQVIQRPGSSSTMIFPDRTGTGDLRLDLDEYGAYKTVHFASETNRPATGDIFRGQRQVFKLRFPDGRSTYDDSIRLRSRPEDGGEEYSGRAADAEEESRSGGTMASPNDTDT